MRTASHRFLKKYSTDFLLTAACIFIFTLIIFLSANIPFFWTMGYVGSLANKIYDSNFSQFIFDIDNGMPPLYGTYIALLWTVFGKSLLVMHLAVLPFLFGIVFQFKKIAKALYPEISLLFLFLLLLFEPTFLTVCLMGGYDLAIIFFFLYSLNAIYFKKKNIFFILSLLVLPMLNLRGFTIVFGIFFYDIYSEWKKFNRKNFFGQLIKFFFPYLIPAFIFCCWLLYHNSIQDWYIVHSDFDSFQKLNTAEMFLRNFAFIFWKIFDFGRIFIWIPIIILALKLLFRKKLFNKEYHAFIFLGFSLLYYFVFYWATSYPVSHRYLLISIIVAIIPFLMIVDKIPNKLFRYIVIIITCIILFFGNFIMYPERFGNGWDASIKFIPYFKIEKELDSYVSSKGINSKLVGSEYPMHFSRYDTYLTNDNFKFSDIDKKDFEKWDYIVQSNISNTFTPEEVMHLEKDWILMKEFKSWPVYIRLYKNPNTN